MDIKKIGILTSGGDGPGMNAAIRSLTRCALKQGWKVAGIKLGYRGILEELIEDFDHRSVSNILNRGGTILKTDRCPEFRDLEVKKRGVEILKKHGIDALAVIGGDGSYRGAAAMWEHYQFPVVGLPGTIDNDIYGTDSTIGCHTAVNTAIDAIDKIRDTAHSMERVFVVEVMGNKSGYIAISTALGAGAEEVIIPERPYNLDDICTEIEDDNAKGKISWILIVAEGVAKGQDVADYITKNTTLESRAVVLGHIQRGGSPTGLDRINATRMGAAAIDLLKKGNYGKAVGIVNHQINVVDLKEAANKEFRHIDEYTNLIRTLT